MTSATVRATLEAAIGLLERLNLPYALMGAMSLGFYGRLRATDDVDLLVAGDSQTLDRLRDEAQREGFSIDEQWSLYNPGLRDTHVRLVRSGVPVDMMLPRDDQDRSAADRRRQHVIETGTIWVVAPEDLILQKLKAGRPRDFDDAIPIFARNRAQLDHDYLNEWARRLGVREELDYLWSQSGRAEP